MGWLPLLRPRLRAAEPEPEPEQVCAYVPRSHRTRPPQSQPAELGSMQFCNIVDGTHGDMGAAIARARESGRPILALFAEWPGWRGCVDAGRIFADADVVRAADECFVAAAFNTWDRYDSKWAKPHHRWGSELAGSWWGYVRVISADGNTVVAKTRQLVGRAQLGEVKQALVRGLRACGQPVPSYLQQ